MEQQTPEQQITAFIHFMIDYGRSRATDARIVDDTITGYGRYISRGGFGVTLECIPPDTFFREMNNGYWVLVSFHIPETIRKFKVFLKYNHCLPGSHHRAYDDAGDIITRRKECFYKLREMDNPSIEEIARRASYVDNNLAKIAHDDLLCVLEIAKSPDPYIIKYNWKSCDKLQIGQKKYTRVDLCTYIYECLDTSFACGADYNDEIYYEYLRVGNVYIKLYKRDELFMINIKELDFDENILLHEDDIDVTRYMTSAVKAYLRNTIECFNKPRPFVWLFRPSICYKCKHDDACCARDSDLPSHIHEDDLSRQFDKYIYNDYREIKYQELPE